MNETFLNFFEERDETVFLIEQVTKIHDHGGKSSRKLALTDEGIYFIEGNKPLKSMRSAIWRNLETVVSISDIECNLIFVENIIFHFVVEKTDSNIPKIIVYLLQKLLTEEEQKNTKLDKFISNQKIQPSTFSIFSRFQQAAKCMEIKISKDDSDLFKNLMIFKNKTLNISDFSITTYPAIIDSLYLCNFIKILEYSSKVSAPAYKILQSFVKDKQIRIPNVQICGNQDFDDFSTFVDLIYDNENILSLTFKDTKIEDDQLKILQDRFSVTKNKENNIKLLSFSNSIQQKTLDFFHKKFILSNLMKNISILILDQMKGLDIQRIFKNIPQILCLSLQNCDLDISNIFDFITKKHFLPNIQKLNLSYNKCSKTSKFELPVSFDTLICDYIKWDDSVFPHFLSNLFSNLQIKDLNLSLKNIQINKKDWENTNKIFEKTHYTNLKSLIWDMNPITKQFLYFLSSCSNLKLLSICDSFSSDDKPTIKEFSSTIPYLVSLETLLLRGSDKNKMKDSANTVLNSMTSLENLQYVDISNNNISQDSYVMIPQLSSAISSLKVTVIDGSNPSYENIIKLGENLSSLKRNFVPLPVNDINSLLEQRKITIKQKKDLYAMWQRLNNKETTEKMLDIQKQFFDENFEILNEKEFDLFPYSIDQDLINQINLKNPIKKTEKTKSNKKDKISSSSMKASSPNDRKSVFAHAKSANNFDSDNNKNNKQKSSKRNYLNDSEDSSSTNPPVEIITDGSDDINQQNPKAQSLRRKPETKQQNEEQEEQIAWGFILPLVPQAIDQIEMDAINDQYSLPNLLKKLKKQT